MTPFNGGWRERRAERARRRERFKVGGSFDREWAEIQRRTWRGIGRIEGLLEARGDMLDGSPAMDRLAEMARREREAGR